MRSISPEKPDAPTRGGQAASRREVFPVDALSYGASPAGVPPRAPRAPWAPPSHESPQRAAVPEYRAGAVGDGLVPNPSVVSRMNRGLSWREAAREAMSEAADELEAADRAIAAAHARRIRAIEAIRVLAVETVGGLDPTLGPVDPLHAERVVEIRRQQALSRRAARVEVSCVLRTPETTTTSLMEDAQALLDRHPATMAALTDGEISHAHAGVVLESTVALGAEDCRALEATLVERAKGSTLVALRRFARRERERTHPRPLAERHRERMEDRHVEIEPARDGMMWLHQYLPAAQATAIYNRLTDVAATCQGPDESRTLAQLRADVFSALLLDDAAAHLTSGDMISGAPSPGAVLGGPPAGGREGWTGPSLRGVQPSVAVTVPVMTLLGRSDAPAHLEGYGPVDADTARELAGRATSFTRILTHPETAVVLSVGRQKYAVPADLKTWLRLRDETCRFPGCSRRAARCDIDHIAPWQTGGGTDHDNLIHLCRHHHRLKHETGWSVARVDDGGDRSGRDDPGDGDVGPSDGDVGPGDGDVGPGDGDVGPGGGDGRQEGEESRTSDSVKGAFARPGAVTWRSPADKTYVSHPAMSPAADGYVGRPALLSADHCSGSRSSSARAGESSPRRAVPAMRTAQRPVAAPEPFPEQPPF